MQLIRLFCVSVFVLLQACRGSLFLPPDSNHIITDAETDVRSEDNIEGTSAELPGYMWSQSRREATASYLYLTSEYMLLQGDLAKSAQLVESAYNLDPNAHLAAKLISINTLRGDVSPNMDEAKRMILLYPQSVQLRVIYATILLKEKQFEEAQKQFEKILSMDPLQESAYLGLVLLFQNQKRKEKLIEIGKKFVVALPSSTQAWSTLARIYITNDMRKECLEPARKAYELNSANPETILILAMALELNDQSKEAIVLYEQIYRIVPNNEELVSRMVEIYRQLGGLEAAMDLLTELSTQSPEKKPLIEMQRAIIFWELKKFKEASSLLEDLLVEYPDSDRLLYLAGLGQEKLNEYEKALDRYQKIPEQSGFKSSAELRRLVIYSVLGQHENATKSFETLIANKEKSTEEVYLVYASSLSEQDKNLEALKIIKDGLASFQESLRLLFMRAVYEEKTNQRSQSKQSMRSYLQKKSDDSAALNFLGYMLAEDGENLDEAESLIKKALSIKGQDGFYLDSLGWVYFQKKQYEKALTTLKQALEFEKEEGVIYEHLARTYDALQNWEEAKKHFEMALSKKLDARDKKRIEELRNNFMKRYNHKNIGQ